MTRDSRCSRASADLQSRSSSGVLKYAADIRTRTKRLLAQASCSRTFQFSPGGQVAP
jgi:hypothetical protein